MEDPSFALCPRSPSLPSAESSSSLLQVVKMWRAERPPRVPHQCPDCGQIFHDDEALAVHRTHDDCTTADSTDVHLLGSGTDVVQRTAETIQGIPGQYVHPNRSAPRYSFPSHAPPGGQLPKNPNHILGSEKKLIDLNRMPSLSGLSNPTGEQNPMRNVLLPLLQTSHSASFDADDPKGKKVLVDLNEPYPYPKEFLSLNNLFRIPDLDVHNLAPRSDTDLVATDLMSPLSPNRNREIGLRPRDGRNGNSDQAVNLSGLLARSGPAEATAAVEEDGNPMAVDLTLHL